jgi:hypothetical protein
MVDPESNYHWHRLDDRITTSGQPSETQLADIAALGVRYVINLGLHSHEKIYVAHGQNIIQPGSPSSTRTIWKRPQPQTRRKRQRSLSRMRCATAMVRRPAGAAGSALCLKYATIASTPGRFTMSSQFHQMKPPLARRKSKTATGMQTIAPKDPPLSV